MSDTPRTDALPKHYARSGEELVSCAHARQLERDLIEAIEDKEDAESRFATERAERQKEVGAQEYRGNTVSYIYDKCANYGRHFDEKNKRISELERENAELWKALKERAMGNGPIDENCSRFIICDGHRFAQVDVSNQILTSSPETWAAFTIKNLLRALTSSARNAEQAEADRQSGA